MLAFLLRYLYNAVFMEHRIAHYGDAYNFLRSGTCLLAEASKSANLFEFISRIYHSGASQTQGLQSMVSMSLSDRLQIDGPVYPAYLAFVQRLFGVNPQKPIFDAFSVQIALCNSFLDSLTCVLIYLAGRLAFNRRVAFIAGLTFAFYPAAIINTQHCYSEPFSYFLLSIWTALVLKALLRHQKQGRTALALSWGSIGIVSGLMMLSKPAFILIPPLLAAILMPLSALKLLKSQTQTGLLKKAWRRYAGRTAAALLGAALVLLPWAAFNKAVNGKYSITVNRVPSFNIFAGNYIEEDGWRCYPLTHTFPGDTEHVLSAIVEKAGQNPLAFLGLQIKKLARLWAAVWNEYHYSLFFIPLELQSLFHQLLLLMASISLGLLLFASKHKTLSRSFTAASVFAGIVLFHFAYIPFETISRYAVTAMPAVVLLAAFYISRALKSRQRLNALALVLLVTAAAFLALSKSGETANLIAAYLPVSALDFAPWLSLLLGGSLLLISLLFSFRVLASMIETRKALLYSKLFTGSIFLLVTVVAGFYTIQSHDWREWQCKISATQSIRQSIRLPVDALSPLSSETDAFVLVDMSAETLAPPLALKINGKELSEEALPLAQLQTDNHDILQCLAIQAEGMSRDIRSFRNWWVVPFKANLLKAGADNKLEIRTRKPGEEIIVYGDYPDSGLNSDPKTAYLPSIRTFSYTKGFTTFDHRDPRVIEKLRINGSTRLAMRLEKAPDSMKASQDLSEASGKQYGQYRVRILVPVEKAAATKTPNRDNNYQGSNEPDKTPLFGREISFVDASAPKIVNGQNPYSFKADNSPLKIGRLPEGSRFSFKCISRNLHGNRPYFVGLSFTGLDSKNEQQSWSSEWQPIAIAYTANSSGKYNECSFSDIIPADVLALKNLELNVLFSPFQPDLLFLKRKEALKSMVEFKSANLRFLPPLQIPALDSIDWKVF